VLHELPVLAPGEWEGHEAGATVAPKPVAAPDPRHVPAHGAGDAAFAPLDDSRLSRSLDELVARRVVFLTDYQDAKYAKRYADLVARVRAAEEARAPGSSDLAEAVARYAFKLMAYKDEYEVARLYTSGEFQKRVAEQFEGDYKLTFHLAPPLLAKKNAEGQLLKRTYGPWVFSAFRVLAKLKFLRET